MISIDIRVNIVGISAYMPGNNLVFGNRRFKASTGTVDRLNAGILLVLSAIDLGAFGGSFGFLLASKEGEPGAGLSMITASRKHGYVRGMTMATMERKSVGILGGSGFSPFLLNLSSAIH